MGLEDKTGLCLVSQEIKELINQRAIKTSSLNESKIQPSSFEPSIGNEIFILDTETKGIFRPNPNRTVYQTLLQLPKRRRQKKDIEKGFVLNKGFTYLIHLEEKIRLSEGMHIKASPKSSMGRLFLNTRLISDYNRCFDEVNYLPEKEIDIWLLVQPLAFNVVLHPELSLNQIRFLNSYDAQLSSRELKDEFEKNPFLVMNEGDSSVPAEPRITDGIEIHLNLSGANTQGIVGLRARHNPEPIDLNKKGAYEAEDFFEPVKGDKLTIRKGEYYLLSSEEILKIPPHLNVEMRSHSHIGFTGPMHFAGFIDNGFEGDLVFEVRSDEISNMELEHGMPVSKLDVFKTRVPDKIYGDAIGSNYQKQTGTKPSKHFKKLDFDFAARNYKKLYREVLVQDASLLTSLRVNNQGFETLMDKTADKLTEILNNGFFQFRYDCEEDELILQPISYLLLFGKDKTVFSYIRAKNIQDYGDKRLFGKHSIGVGGHIIKDDAPDYITEGLRRETEDEVKIMGDSSKPKLIGTLVIYDTPVDRVHLGLVFTRHVDGDVTPAESSIITGKMVGIDDIINDKQYKKKYENWSKVLIPHLHQFYDM